MLRRMTLVCGVALVATGCGGGGGGGGGGNGDGGGGPATIHVTGTVARRAGRLGGAGLGTADLPGVGDGSQIDRVVALSHRKGMIGQEAMDNAIIVDLPADGAFDLELQAGLDYVILLEDSTAPRWERIRAYVTLADLDASLMTLPLSRAAGDLALGKLTAGDDGSAQAETTLTEAAPSFTLDRSTLTEMARVDDAYRSLINTWLNYDRTTGTYWHVSPSVMFSDRFDRVVSGASGPEGYTFLGYIIYLESNDPQADPAAICAGTQTLRLIPPADVRTIDGVTWGPSRPLSTAAPESYPDGSCWAAEFGGFRAEADGRLSLSTFLFGEMVEGWWTIEVDGVAVAKLDLSLASPVDADGRALGAMPRLRPTIAGDGRLEAIDVDWLRWSAADSDWVDADPAALEALFPSTGMGVSSLLWGTAPVMAEEPLNPPPGELLVTHAAPTAYDWYTGVAHAGAPLVGELNVFWEIGGVSYRTMFTRSCMDFDYDGQTDCDGDADDVVPDASTCRIANAARPGADEEGTLWQSVQASYWGSFNLVANCAWAPGPRAYSRVTWRVERLDGTVLAEGDQVAYWAVAAALDDAGAGDYRLVTTAYDGLGDAHETIETYFHALPFEATFAAPAITARLSATSLEVVFNYRAETWESDTTLLCGILFDAATQALFGAAGCDTALSSSADCGACGNQCGGSETCTAGICYDAGGACTWPAADCDANPATGPNGCERDLQTDAAHCGACGRACGAGADCVAGFCRERCSLVTGDCDANPGTGPDGCESDLLTSAAHCGACGRACTAGETCADGLCISASSGCAPGRGDCDGQAGTGPGGCESDLYTDGANCGGCGLSCPAGTRCRGGACHARCPAGAGDCVGTDDVPYLPFTCFYVGDGLHFRMEWGANAPPIRVGDRITLAHGVPWGCEGIDQYPTGYLIPCPEVFPQISTRVVAAP